MAEDAKVAVEGALHSADGAGVVHIKAHLNNSINDVWSALVDPRRLALWFGSVKGELRVGGEFAVLVLSSGFDGRGRIGECLPGRRLRVRMWEEEGKQHVVTAAISADRDLTMLELEVRAVPLDLVWAFGAGWHEHVEDLGAHLRGQDRAMMPSGSDARFEELAPRYRAMTVEPLAQVHVTRRIEATADRIFDVVANPQRHPLFDGSGMLREGEDGSPVANVGDRFVMHMHNEEFGDYDMVNHVVEFEANRRITWAPTRGDNHPEGASDLPQDGHAEITWSYDLEPLTPTTTLVTETYDCSNAPDDLRRVLRNGERWRESMIASLEKLDEMCGAGASSQRDLA